MTNASKTLPFFSVITITSDNLDGLKRTQKSLTAQSCTNYEWIVIDNNSKDGSAAYLKKTKARWSSEKDKSIYDAMNKGIDRAQGTYLIFMNAGDEFATPDILEKITEKIKEIKPDFIYGDAQEKDFYKYARPYHKITQGMFTHHQSMLYRREKIGNLRYNLKYKIAADYDFTLRFLKNIQSTFYCPFSICLFESGGISQTNARLGRNEQFQIRKTEKQIFLSNVTIFTAQTFNLFLRRNIPRLYHFLKGRPQQVDNKQNASKQIQTQHARPKPRPLKNKNV